MSAAAVEAVEQTCYRQCGEGHCHAGHVADLHPQMECGHRYDGDQSALEEDPVQKVFCHNSLVRVTRLLIQQIFFGVFHADCQSRK